MSCISNIVKEEFFTMFTSQPHWPLRSSQSLARPCRLLILDSSFNPPTKAHANLLTKAVASRPLHYFDASLLLFSTINADKKLTGANVEQRANMMQLMAKHVDNCAVGLTTHAKFIDKAHAIQSWFQGPVQLYFILGCDTMIRLFDQKYYTLPVKQALAPFFDSGCHLICADRGEDNKEFWSMIAAEYNSDAVTRIQLDPAAEAISSTLARSLLASKQYDRLKDVLEDSIVEYIQEQDLYN